MATLVLSTPLTDLLRTTKDHLKALEEMGIKTVENLLLYLPRSHEDLSRFDSIASAKLDEKVTIRGIIDHLKYVRTRHGKKLVSGKFLDGDGDIVDVLWFNQPHIMRILKDGDEVALTGKLMEKGSKLQFMSPTFEKSGGGDLIHAGRLVSIYPEHDIINTKWLREKMTLLKEAIDLLPETLPEEIIKEENFPSRRDAVRSLHFPEKPEEVERALNRFAFEQMYAMQRDALERKKELQGEKQERLKIPMNVELIRSFFASLHFTPTDSQRIAIYEILKDLEKEAPMSRLLEGDVGSGKTLVATAVMANVIQSGGQCAFMVPTEVLARQHVQSIGKMLIGLHNFRIRESDSEPDPRIRVPSVRLLTGSVPTAESREIKQGLINGTIDIVIGTHALITEDVVFRDLRLVIVDEQHRFGVEQRARLKEKGNPHFLTMTATPIPRTLALTAYGHHDLSVLLEKPGNRKPIHTKVVSPKDRKTVEHFIDQQIAEGRQIFVICPLIAESGNEEMAEVRSVQQESKRLAESFPHRRIAVLHGKMPPSDKETAMKNFKEKASDILVSTSVIEVGIDVPNASIIVIEGAERFGLAQLHQFRGRVGRADHLSHCFLFTTTPAQARSPRLKAMEEHHSGFTLAEIDLQIRGPGELFGLRQSGIPEGHLHRLFRPELVLKARKMAERFFAKASVTLESEPANKNA